MNYAPLTGAKLERNIDAGASPCAILCRPYGTRILRKFYRTPIYHNELCAPYRGKVCVKPKRRGKPLHYTMSSLWDLPVIKLPPHTKVINTLFNISSTPSVHNPMFMHTSALPHPGTLTTRSPVHPLPTYPQHPTRQRRTPTPVKTTFSVDNSAKHCLSIKRYY